MAHLSLISNLTYPTLIVLPDATAGFADTRPETELEVCFSEQAIEFCMKQQNTHPHLYQFIC